MPIHSPDLLAAAVAAAPVIRKNAVLHVLKNEPARVVSFVIAAIGVATSFGLGITDGQQSAIVALVGAVLALVGGEAVRAQVTPVAKLVEQAISAVAPAADKTAPAAPAPAPTDPPSA